MPTHTTTGTFFLAGALTGAFLATVFFTGFFAGAFFTAGFFAGAFFTAVAAFFGAAAAARWDLGLGGMNPRKVCGKANPTAEAKSNININVSAPVYKRFQYKIEILI